MKKQQTNKTKNKSNNNQTNKKQNKKTPHTHTIELNDFLSICNVPVKYNPPPTNNEADKQGKKQTIAEGEPGIAVECFAVCSELIVLQRH